MRGERDAVLRWESSPRVPSAADSSRPDSGAGGSNAVFVVGHDSPPCVSCRRWRIHFAKFKRAEVAIVGKPPLAGQEILRVVFCLGLVQRQDERWKIRSPQGRRVFPFARLLVEVASWRDTHGA